MKFAERERLQTLARNLYAHGHSMEEISRRTGVHVRSIYRWRDLDGTRGLDWADLRAETRRLMPRALIGALEMQIARTLQDDTISPSRKADALLKFHAVLRAERAYVKETETDAHA